MCGETAMEKKKKDKDEGGVRDAPSSSKRKTPAMNTEIPDAADKEEMKRAKKSLFGQKEERERRGIKTADIDEDQIHILQDWSTTAKRGRRPLIKPRKENEGESSARGRPQLQANDNAGKWEVKLPIRKKKREPFEIKKWALEQDPVKQEGESSAQIRPEIQAIDNAGKGKEKLKFPIRKKKEEPFEIKKWAPEEDPVKQEGVCSARVRPEIPAIENTRKGKEKMPIRKKENESFKIKMQPKQEAKCSSRTRPELQAIDNAGKRKKKEKTSLETKQQVEGGNPVKQEDREKGKEKMTAENQDSDNKEKPEISTTTPPPQNKHKCVKCGLSFPTHHALGGHSSSHNKTRLSIINTNGRFGPIMDMNMNMIRRKKKKKKKKTEMSNVSVNIDLNRLPEEEDAVPSTLNKSSSNISVSLDLNMMPPNVEDDDDGS